jgi:hypothetical protein
LDVDKYSPPFTVFDRLPSHLPILIKIAPAADAPAGWNRATVASGKECSEQLLHRNLGLPSICALHANLGIRWEPSVQEAPVPVRTPRYLIEPHAAIIRTGCVAEYLREHHAEPIDPNIAYGLSEIAPPASPWHQRFAIVRIDAFNRKRLKRIAHELDFSATTEIKKRGFPDSPEELLSELKLKGSTKGVVFLARRGDRHVIVFGMRMPEGNE